MNGMGIGFGSCPSKRPDVVVMDVGLANGSGIEATREIRAKCPQIQVLMLTSFADDEALSHR